jgi:hypothetical protein
MIEFGSINTNTYSPTRQETDETSPVRSTKDRFNPDNTDKPGAESKEQKPSGTKAPQELRADEIRELTKLKQRDREVKAHEQAHIASGGSYVKGGAKFEYETGPDGKKYAVGGEVQIDTSKVSGDPEATLRKMQAIRGAALAPATPSGTDRKIAAQATQIENQARLEILTQKYEEAKALRDEAVESTGEDTASAETTGKRPAISLGGLIDLTQ